MLHSGKNLNDKDTQMGSWFVVACYSTVSLPAGELLAEVVLDCIFQSFLGS